MAETGETLTDERCRSKEECGGFEAAVMGREGDGGTGRGVSRERGKR